MERQLITYEVTLNDLKFNTTDKLIGILDRLREDGTRFRNSLIITCHAYNDIPDELHTIPKFRRWIRKVANLRPFFLYYLCTDIDTQVHVIGCLGDVETVVMGERITMKEIEEQNLSQDDFPLVPTIIFFDEDIYHKMRSSITSLCDDLDDYESKEQLLSFLEHHHRK
ncbi:hypothetical protein NDS46_31415 (plasmid) [Paenibacillus thiaminolyticus]|uniref:hypothetical protein n=1 Tax=Paenibacillus thiaminolyticus TaxID=49283 RepID=UPI00232B0C6D|nr:hypothetical protein [Paenibacillus thiaminolyticus]WCF11468.1 hypothetical protein NDS46_31415 [Paenibacillus thiaminolyticus]